jgi:hypothetical protein
VGQLCPGEHPLNLTVVVTAQVPQLSELTTALRETNTIMADLIAPVLAQAATTLVDVVAQLKQIATNIANNPNIPQADVTAAQTLVTTLGTVDSTLKGLVTQTGGGGNGIPPVVASISPATGPIAGGTVVAISGSGFTGATNVLFGGVAATTFSIAGDTSISATSPAASTPGTDDVTVVGPGGTSGLSPADQFVYV